MKRAVFLDRDGVINRAAPEGQYVTRWEELQFLPGVAQAITLLNGAGFRVIVVTNQRCVARGLLTVAALKLIHQRMCSELAAGGAVIDDVFFCPHEKQPPCSCRKPAPGMLLAAALKHQIDLTTSWMIGDSDIDIEAGRNAGCRTARILKKNEVAGCIADLSVHSLLEAIPQILPL
jgi:D-glycero-D-manno-heptose 1,7-bisphosphate phosphatase